MTQYIVSQDKCDGMSNIQRAIDNWEVEVRRGVIVLLVLATLWNENLHGMALVDKIAESTAATIKIPLGTIYPLLKRFIADNMIETLKSPDDARRTIYTLNSNGREFFIAARELWLRYSSAVNNLLDLVDETRRN